jgi:hypothetical protein
VNIFLTPLTWCEFRRNGQDGMSYCDSFASVVMAGMAFCPAHRQYVEEAMDTNEVTLVPYLQSQQVDQVEDPVLGKVKK